MLIDANSGLRHSCTNDIASRGPFWQSAGMTPFEAFVCRSLKKLHPVGNLVAQIGIKGQLTILFDNENKQPTRKKSTRGERSKCSLDCRVQKIWSVHLPHVCPDERLQFICRIEGGVSLYILCQYERISAGGRRYFRD